MLAVVVVLLLGRCLASDTATPDDCPQQLTCETCLLVKSFGHQLCVWCRSSNSSNATCGNNAYACPVAESDSVNDYSNCEVLSKAKLTLIISLSAAGAALILCGVGCFWYCRRLKEQAEMEQLQDIRLREEKVATERQKVRDRAAQRKEAEERNKHRTEMAQHINLDDPNPQLDPGHGQRDARQPAPTSSPRAQQPHHSHHSHHSHQSQHSQDEGRARNSSMSDVGQRWQVLSKGGLRIRGSPEAESEQTGKLACGAIVVAVSRKGHWLEHDQGWSMICDPTKEGGKMFLQLVEGPAPQPKPRSRGPSQAGEGEHRLRVEGHGRVASRGSAPDSPGGRSSPKPSLVAPRSQDFDEV